MYVPIHSHLKDDRNESDVISRVKILNPGRNITEVTNSCGGRK